MNIVEEFNSIQFIFKEEQNFENCILLNGWHGIGECGFISMSHLVDKLKAKRIGFIITDNLPQFITVKKETITFPFEIYRKDNVVIVLPIFEPVKSEHQTFTRTLVQWSINRKFNKALLVGGLDNRLKDKTSLKIICTKSFKNKYPLVDLEILEEGLYVTGPLAYMLLFYELEDFPAIAILPYSERSRPDPIAASIAIKQINALLNLNVNVDELLEEAERIEKEIESLLNARKQPKEQEESKDRGMFV